MVNPAVEMNIFILGVFLTAYSIKYQTASDEPRFGHEPDRNQVVNRAVDFQIFILEVFYSAIEGYVGARFELFGFRGLCGL